MRYLKRFMKAAAPHAVETATYVGASFAFGYAQNRYREKASLAGVPADLLAGGGLKLGVVLGEMLGGSKVARYARLADPVANAGLGAYFHTWGSGAGAKASGLKRVLVSASDADRVKKLVPGATILGDIARAPHGDYLSASQLAALARG
jgi:hypothetical protein